MDVIRFKTPSKIIIKITTMYIRFIVDTSVISVYICFQNNALDSIA